MDRTTLAAVRKLQAEEARLHKRLLAEKITAEEHFLLWSVLRRRTPPEVHRARLTIEMTRPEARSNEPGAAEDGCRLLATRYGPSQALPCLRLCAQASVCRISV